MVEDPALDEHKRVIGRDAQRNNILAARVIAETVKTTLGPKGMDKMLVDRTGRVTVTNDGVTILEEMDIEHPAAKMIVDIAKTQEKEVGDGTTTSVMIAGKLLEHAELLLDKKIHATVITRGYRWAEEKAQEILHELSVEVDSTEALEKVAATAMTGKGAEHLKELFSKIVVEAVNIVANGKEIDPDAVFIETQKGRALEETELIKGVVIGKGKATADMPRRVVEAKVLLLEEALEVRNPETEARISVTSPEQLQRFIQQEDLLLKEKVERIVHSGTRVVFCQRGIDDSVKYQLAKEKILAVQRVSREELDRVQKVTGAVIVSKLRDLEISDLGYAGRVEEPYGMSGVLHIIDGKNPEVVTILIRGNTDHSIEETKRAIEDAIGDVIAVVRDTKVVAGGGAVEIELSKRLMKYAKTLGGRERLAVEEYAKAIECIPITLAENAGLDPLDILTELRASHDVENTHYGINLFTGRIEDTLQEGIIEPLKIKTQAIAAATEVANMILRIDDVIAAKTLPKSTSLSLDSMRSYD